MKKTLALVLALMMVLCLCACGDTAEETTAPAVEAAPAADAAAAPAADAAPAVDGAAEGEATGEMSGEPQAKELYSAAGYEKTFEGYKSYVSDAMSTDEGNPFLADELATVAAATEADYDATANPWAMQIEFGLILSYEDFLAA